MIAYVLALAAVAAPEAAVSAPRLANRTALDAAGFNANRLPLIDAAGTGVMDLQIAPDGSLAQCTMTDWSGTGKRDAAMEKLVCAGLRKNARFVPARDGEGRLVPGTLHLAVDPQLTDEPDLKNINEVFNDDSFPVEEMKDRKASDVLVSAAIGADGKMTACTIRKSSGIAAVDEKTCRALKDRGRFGAAHDASGKAIPGEYRLGVRYSSPDWLTFADYRFRVKVAYDAAGKVASCVGMDGLPEPMAKGRCDGIAQSAVDLAADNDLKGKSVVFEDGLLIGGPDSANTIGHGPGETLFGNNAIALKVDADGKVVGCRSVGDIAIADPAQGPCAAYTDQAFQPIDEDTTDVSDRHAVAYWAIYLPAAGR